MDIDYAILENLYKPKDGDEIIVWDKEKSPDHVGLSVIKAYPDNCGFVPVKLFDGKDAVVAGDGADADPGQGRRCAAFDVDDMGQRVGDDLVAGAALRQNGDVVAHGARRQQKGRLLAHHRSDPFAQAIHGRVVAVLFVTVKLATSAEETVPSAILRSLSVWPVA